MTSPAPFELWMLPAGEALGLAIKQRYEDAAMVVNQMARSYPGCIAVALQAWLDTMIKHLGISEEVAAVRASGGEIGFVWQEDRPGAPFTSADDAPAGAVWAGRLLAARLDMDQDQWMALLHSIKPDDFSDGVTNVLLMCGVMMRRHFATNGIPLEDR